MGEGCYGLGIFGLVLDFGFRVLLMGFFDKVALQRGSRRVSIRALACHFSGSYESW